MLRRFYNRLIESRQHAANREIAKILHMHEYPYESYEYVYANIVAKK
jgi:hypothetical protein